ncbi:MAG: epoxyqueuosine reductase QueH [Oscillospiraceae bacterium]|nr:epoxyqueuosine reductase QueH [Oscillospiraceae bacterium]
MDISGKPRLLLHSCCAPCSSYVIERLSDAFDITVFYYNPNIYPIEEYEKRAEWQRKLPELLGLDGKVKITQGEYDPRAFYEAARGYETQPEGGERCRRCFELRLEATAARASELRCDAFTTTLSVSPHKDARAINEAGAAASRKYGVEFLHSDFKKRGGYLRSVELSKKNNIYRQRYCGCEFSMRGAATT